MKQLHALACTLCALCYIVVHADAQKVVVIQKSTDQFGIVQEVTVTEGAAATEILRESDAPHPDCNVMKHVTVTVNDNENAQEIELDINGETEVIRLAKGETLSPEIKARLQEKGVHIDETGGLHSDKFIYIKKDKGPYHFDLNLEGLSKDVRGLAKGIVSMGDGVRNFQWEFPAHRGINCAALGVYITSAAEGGAYVSGIIDASGAQEAGLSRGDVIIAIADLPTTTYGQLHEAIGQFEPGDVVTVSYLRNNVEHHVEAQLRAWKEFPSFQDRPHARVGCDKEVLEEELVTRKIIVIKKDREEEVEESITPPENIHQGLAPNTLALAEFTAFPNPSDGRFTLQFSGEPQPAVVSVFDANGRELYRERVNDFNGYYSRVIDLSTQAHGALVISVEQNGHIYAERIMVH